jgi:hypothetical protein
MFYVRVQAQLKPSFAGEAISPVKKLLISESFLDIRFTIFIGFARQPFPHSCLTYRSAHMSILRSTNSIKMVLILCLLTVCSSVSPIAAFGQSSSSAVNGVVTDPVKDVVPGAKVILRNADTNVERITVSNGAGDYFFSSVPPARYTLTFSAPSSRPKPSRPLRSR